MPVLLKLLLKMLDCNRHLCPFDSNVICKEAEKLISIKIRYLKHSDWHVKAELSLSHYLLDSCFSSGNFHDGMWVERSIPLLIIHIVTFLYNPIIKI